MVPLASTLVICGTALCGPTPEVTELGTQLEGNVEIPTLGTLDGQTIYCVYSNATRSIWIQSTSDAGRTWSEPVKVMDLVRPLYVTDANILVGEDRITVFATHALEFATRSVERRAVSEDGGRTWDEVAPVPIDRSYVCGLMNMPIRLRDGTVLMGYSWDVPAEEGKPAGGEGGMFLKSGVLISGDDGRTWEPGEDVSLDIKPIGADEPAIVELSNGDIFMVLRTASARPYETISHDGGRTWEIPEPSRFHGHNSPTALLRLRDGSIVRAWDNSPTNRFPLVVSISGDDCRTWSPPRLVTEPEVGDDGALSYVTACYPSLAEADDGTILLAWWERSAGGNAVRYARLDRDWIEEARDMPGPVKIVAFGDSVTKGVRPGVTEYHTFRHLLQSALKERGIDVEVIDAGVGSDNTALGLARLERDVLAQGPALVTVMFGLNDAAMVDGGPVARAEPRVPLQAYIENLRTMVTRIREAGAQVLLCTPNPMSRAYAYSDVGAYAENDDMNYQVRVYAQAVRDLAEELGVSMLDAFSLFDERETGLALIEDGCHPYVEGHRLIADAMLGPVEAMLREE